MTAAEMVVGSVWVVAALTALVVVVRRGFLGRRAFIAAPPRAVGLVLLDLVVAFLLFLIGSAIHDLVTRRFLAPGSTGPSEAGGSAGAVQLYQAVLGQVLGQLPVVVYLGWRAKGRRHGWKILGLAPRSIDRDVPAGVLGFLVALPLVMGTMVLVVAVCRWLGWVVPQYGHELLVTLSRSESGWVTLGLIASAVLVAPVLEEAVFRGLVQTVLLETFGASWRWRIVTFSAATFALVHTGQAWQSLPGLWVLGMVLGWLYERTGSLLPGVIVHGAFNAWNVAIVLWLSSSG